MTRKKTGWIKRFKNGGLILLLLFVLATSVIAIFNLNLPTQSPNPDKLSDIEQIRMNEINHLRTTLGDTIWPGWGNQEIPIVIYNEAYVFLAGIEEPTSGWVRVPYKAVVGGPWQSVENNQKYYKQHIPEDGQTPQAFIVEIGDTFAASMTTKDWTKIKLMQLIKDELPNFLKPIMPYSLIINKFDSDWHITSILHESFHAFQAQQNYERVKLAESLNSMHDSYPWRNLDFREKWVEERHLLASIMTKNEKEDITVLVREWLKIRENRRAFLNPDQIHYERQREWLEGLAKYAELQSWKLASNPELYTPLAEMKDDSDFNFYQNAEAQRTKEIRQLRSDLGFSESMFYYSGWAQAELLDRLNPNWKSRAMASGVYLDEMIEESLSMQPFAEHK
jgi:hypothetical protein